VSDISHDVFISYSSKDQPWISDQLLPRLDRAQLNVCIDFRDFQLGIPILENIERAIVQSRHTLVVLTPAWVSSSWAHFESILGQTLTLEQLQRRLIPVLLQPCAPPLRIRMLSYADCTTTGALDLQLPRIIAAITGKMRVTELGRPLSGLIEHDHAALVASLKARDYAGARRMLSEVSTADALYYQALMILQGRQPRDVALTWITEIYKLLRNACDQDAQQAHYFYLWAWIQADYGEKYRFYTPPLPRVPALLAMAAAAPVDEIAMADLRILAPGIEQWLTRIQRS
jgi:hypothetical protein